MVGGSNKMKKKSSRSYSPPSPPRAMDIATAKVSDQDYFISNLSSSCLHLRLTVDCSMLHMQFLELPLFQLMTQSTRYLCACEDKLDVVVFYQVTIALIDLSPEFHYNSVPRVSPHSFLQAKAKNTSPYTMLAGPANIFLDNNFIAKVSPSAAVAGS